MTTAIIGLPLILAAGLPIDLARQIQVYRALQNAADAAAVAGATLLSESNYATDVPVLVNSYLQASTAALAATVVLPATVAVTNSTVTVTVSATVPTTILRYLATIIPVSVTAVAGGPGSTITVSATPVLTGAADLNQIFVYASNFSGTKDFSRRVELVDNNNTTYPAGQTTSIKFQLRYHQRIAFELDNLTGGRNAGLYSSQNPSTNAYGSKVGTTNIFYSSDYPTSLNTTNSVSGYSASYQQSIVNSRHAYFGSSATACYVANGRPVPLASYNAITQYGTLASAAQQENVVVNGSCADLTPGSSQNIGATCQELGGQTLSINWNDMGDSYNDADSVVFSPPNQDMSLSFNCANAGPYVQVILTQ